MTPPLLLDLETEAIRAADDDREEALNLLREHWLAGRLTLDEYEVRCEEATAARFLSELRRALRELPHAPTAPAWPPPAVPAPVPAPAAAPSTAILSLVLGVMSLLGVLLSFGFLFLATLPCSTWAWSLGRRVRRAPQGTVGGGVCAMAIVGEVLGIVATVIGCLALTACGIFIAAT